MPSRPDTWTLVALERGLIRVDAESGEIYKRNGDRAEMLDRRTAYGRVAVLFKPLVLAMAHRVVWSSVYGLIPDGLQINHRNRVRWDNRLTNLELVSATGNVRHALSKPDYDDIRPGGLVDPSWLERLDHGDPRPELEHEYAFGMRHDGYALRRCRW